MAYDTLASQDVISSTTQALETRGFKPVVVDSGAAALDYIKTLIPSGATVMNGTSTTLQTIGFVDHLKSGAHGWSNLHEAIVAEADQGKKQQLRFAALGASYYVGSVHAVTQEGEIVVVSASGSQLPHLAFTTQNLLLVVSSKKIVRDLSAAFDRITTQVVPLEDQRMKSATGGAMGTTHAKTLVLHREPAFMGRTVHVILVKEDLGF